MWSDCTSQHIWTTWAEGEICLASQCALGQSAPGSDCISIVDFVKLISKPMSWRTMEQILKQRYMIKFCAKLSKSYTDTNQLIQQAYGESALSSLHVSRWLKMFKEGQEEVIDNPCSGQSSTSCEWTFGMCSNGSNFLDNVITGDETWTFEYDLETKRQNAKWHTPASSKQKKARMTKSKLKTMLVVFFNAKCVVHEEYEPPG